MATVTTTMNGFPFTINARGTPTTPKAAHATKGDGKGDPSAPAPPGVLVLFGDPLDMSVLEVSIQKQYPDALVARANTDVDYTGSLDAATADAVRVRGLITQAVLQQVGGSSSEASDAAATSTGSNGDAPAKASGSMRRRARRRIQREARRRGWALGQCPNGAVSDDALTAAPLVNGIGVHARELGPGFTDVRSMPDLMADDDALASAVAVPQPQSVAGWAAQGGPPGAASAHSAVGVMHFPSAQATAPMAQGGYFVVQQQMLPMQYTQFVPVSQPHPQPQYVTPLYVTKAPLQQAYGLKTYGPS